MTIAALSSGSEETASRKTAKNTGSVVANHSSGGESSVVVTTLVPYHVSLTSSFNRWHMVILVTRGFHKTTIILWPWHRLASTRN